MSAADSSERTLWRTVVVQAIEDATRKTPTGADNGNIRLIRNDAQNWLTHESRDFTEICALADLDPVKVRAFAMQEIAKADNGEALTVLRATSVRRKPAEKRPGAGSELSREAGDRRGVHRARFGPNRISAT